MSIPIRQSAKIAAYLLKQKIKRTDKFPLLVELEPLFQCNLACSFCGKIQYPKEILKKRMQVDQMMLSPAYAYEKAPDQEHFPGVTASRKLFSEAFGDGNRKKWRLNHTPLFLDFLEGKVDYQCTPWGIPSYSIFGWQRPCYLMADGYAETYQELLETTDWSKYGRGRDPRCDNCMAHCGYEPTAVMDTTRSLKQSVRALARR